jgi:hypothetical protein
MANPEQLTWPKIWDEATRKYIQELQNHEDKHKHWFHDKKNIEDTLPVIKTLDAFKGEIERQRKLFGKVQDNASTVLDSMVAIAQPLDMLMSQAGAIAGMVRVRPRGAECRP